jgi:tRNA 2-selenouridine synthase
MIKKDKELFDYIRKLDVLRTPLLSEILKKYNFYYLEFQDFLSLFINNNNILLVDARSEKEYKESHIFNALNFPILSNQERHNVGLIYKKYSQKAALHLALEYANPKYKSLEKFLLNNEASEKQIIIYCWRGGGRSRYLAKMINDIGYKPVLIQQGFKSFRKTVFNYFYVQKFPYNLIELTGLTGSGKTELLTSVKEYFPIIDLEDSAKHYSSLFGLIPFKIASVEPVFNQSAFENNIYYSIINGIKKFVDPKYFLVESESKKIGNFIIPDYFYESIITAISVKIECSLENRINRIHKTYFANNLGIIETEKIFKLKERYFRKELSNKIYDYLILELKKENAVSFISTMLTEFYDKKYKDKGKHHELEINTDDFEYAKEIIKSYLYKYKKIL